MSLKRLGYIYEKKNELDKSMEIRQQALTLGKKLFGENDVDVGLLLNDIGINYVLQKDYPNGVAYYN